MSLLSNRSAMVLFHDDIGHRSQKVRIVISEKGISCNLEVLSKDDLPKEILEINPDGISDNLDYINQDVWDRGYYCETEDGIWYEVYVNDTIKSSYPKIDLSNEDDKETFGGFHDIMLAHYESDNQITFFQPNDETEYTLDELTDILI